MTKRAPTLNTAIDSHTSDVLVLPVAISAFWTLAYQLVLIARWPAQTIVWCFLAMALAGFFLLLRLWKKTDAVPGLGYRFHPSQILLFLLATGCAVTVLFVRRPNLDDIVYFHRALAQVRALGEPIFVRQTTVDIDAAAFSPVHLATSHEMLMALLATISVSIRFTSIRSSATQLRRFRFRLYFIGARGRLGWIVGRQQ